jgi:hypothetical protein
MVFSSPSVLSDSASTEHWLTIVVMLCTIVGMVWRTWSKGLKPRLDSLQEELSWNRRQMEANGIARQQGRADMTLSDRIDSNEQSNRLRHSQNEATLAEIKDSLATGRGEFAAIRKQLADRALIQDARNDAADRQDTADRLHDDRPPRLTPEADE